MGSRGRNYIHGDVEYRGRVVETGFRETYVTVYDETEAEYDARKAAHAAAHPNDRWLSGLEPRYRKQHRESRGLQPYTEDRTYGPYATVGPARAAAGTGRGQSRKVQNGIRHDGGKFCRVHTVEIGRVSWTPLDEEPTE